MKPELRRYANWLVWRQYGAAVDISKNEIAQMDDSEILEHLDMTQNELEVDFNETKGASK